MGSGKRNGKQQNGSAGAKEAKELGMKKKDLSRVDEVLRKVEQMIAAHHYDKAVALLSAAGCDPRLMNAKGVCLMRLGRYDQATRLFHDLVLNPGCTWIRPDASIVHKTNYATALLVGGHVCGCEEILAETNDEQHPTVKQLRAAIKQWESQLSWWQRLNWRFGKIEPANRPVQVDFALGELDILPAATDSQQPAPPPNTRNAA